MNNGKNTVGSSHRWYFQKSTSGWSDGKYYIPFGIILKRNDCDDKNPSKSKSARESIAGIQKQNQAVDTYSSSVVQQLLNWASVLIQPMLSPVNKLNYSGYSSN